VKGGGMSAESAAIALESSVASSSSLSSSLAQIVGSENDALVPKPSEICRIFQAGQQTWTCFIDKAHLPPRRQWPVGFVNPYIALKDIPALPPVLPKAGQLKGRPVWRVPMPEIPVKANNEEDWNPELLYGRQVTLSLAISNPIICGISHHSTAKACGLEETGSLAILTLCWSYILSSWFLERQGRRIQYSNNRIWPVSLLREGGKSCEERAILYLNNASPALVRWLCAVLAPGRLGWRASGNGLPPWASCLSKDVQLVMVAEEQGPGVETAPSSSQAAELLIELYQLYGLRTRQAKQIFESISPYTAGFLAALALPFYRMQELQPQFPHPHLRAATTQTINHLDRQNINQYIEDLPYFTTLSLHPLAIGSILWSVFWQPDIECNLVSPWLASILHVLGPTLRDRDIEILVKTFIFRRPRVAIWWLAIFLLGDCRILDWIPRYLERLEEQFGMGSMSPPDIAISAWTGSMQSYLDEEIITTYNGGEEDLVPRADILRCRLNLKLQDCASIHLAWRPFGDVPKKEIEPDLWPWLEDKCVREYQHFVWYYDSKKILSVGFRKETAREVQGIPDDLILRESQKQCGGECRGEIRIAPSKKSTLQMIHFSVGDMSGDRDWAILTPTSLREHSWLKEWEGLSSQPLDVTDSDPCPKKGSSKHLKEWLDKLNRGKNQYGLPVGIRVIRRSGSRLQDFL
jgi:hypothetical protein